MTIAKCILVSIFVVLALAEPDDDFYCKSEERRYSVCRRCPTIDEKCDKDPEPGCRCENIQVQDPSAPRGTVKLIGGSDCGSGFCYTSKYTDIFRDFYQMWDCNYYVVPNCCAQCTPTKTCRLEFLAKI